MEVEREDERERGAVIACKRRKPRRVSDIISTILP